MTRALPKSIKGFTVFVDGRGKIGRTSSGKLPVITEKTEEYRDGGMNGSSDLSFGIDKMEAEFGFTELDRDVLKAAGSRNLPITLRGSQEGEDGTTETIVGTFRGLVTEVDPGEWGDPKKGEVKMKLTPDYYRLTIGGEEIYEIDIIGGVHRVGGVDKLAQRRAALGL